MVYIINYFTFAFKLKIFKMKQVKLFFTFLLFLLLVNQVNAQVIISGKVIDNKSQPLSGVSIYLKDTYDGATSDSLGRYSFKTFEKAEQILVASAIGFKPFEQLLMIGSEKIDLNITIKEEVTELKAVVLSAGSFEASDRKRSAAVLSPIDIVTTASANGDITGALKTLPGAQQVGESEGLFVRGGTAAETKVFIDGTLVNNFFFTSVPNIAQFSRFSPFLFKGTVFSTGGYSALYGQALSSALILESIDLPEKSSANISATILGPGFGFQQLSKNKKSSWGLEYSYTNLAPAFKLIKQRQEYFKAPTIHNGSANYRIKTSARGMLKYYGYFSANKLGFRVSSIDAIGYKDFFKLNNINSYHNLSWKEYLGNGWKFNSGISYANNEDAINGNLQDQNNQDVTLSGLEFKKFGLEQNGDYFNAKTVFEKNLKGLSALRFGGEYNGSNDKANFMIYNGQVFPNRIKENIKSLFAESDIYLTNAIAAKIGTRFEHSSILNKVNFAPRISLAYKLNNNSQASLAYGIFYQNPERRYLPSVNNLQFAKATHYIAQYQKVVNQRTLRAELFLKQYDNLLKTSFINNRESAVNNNGFGDAKGFELFWRDKKTFKNFDYWVSYSYLDTKRDFLNFPSATQPNFAAKHTASLVMKNFVLPWKTGFNLAYNYASGRPYYNIKNNGSGTVFNDKGVIPDYHNVSFSLNYIPAIGKTNAKTFSVFVLQVSNILNLQQTFGYQYSYDGVRKEAIVPPSRMFVFIGAFINIGVDRTQDAINNNL